MFTVGDKVKVVDSKNIFCGQEGIVTDVKSKYIQVILGSLKFKFNIFSIEKSK